MVIVFYQIRRKVIYKKIDTVPAADLEAGVYIQADEGDFQLVTEIIDIFDEEYPAVQVTTRDHWGEENTTVITFDVMLDIYEEKE